MEQRDLETLSARLARVEAELRGARSARAWALAASCLIALLLIFTRTAPATGGSTSFKAPFVINDSAGKELFSVEDRGAKGRGIFVYNSVGAEVANLGATKYGTGGIAVYTPDANVKARLVISDTGMPDLEFGREHKKILEMAEGTAANEMGLRIWGPQGEAIALEVLRGRGNLQLADEASTLRVEAGTEQNGDGAVKVFGPSGKCGVALANIPCMIVAR